MKRRYDRSRRYGGARWRWLGVILCVVVVGAGVVPAASYTSADVDRQVGADVVSDPNGVVGQVSQRPEYGEVDTFTTVTNRFGSPIEVTIRLRGLSTVYANIDDDGTPDERTVTLAPGQSEAIPICADIFLAIIDPQVRFEYEFEGGGVSGETRVQRTVRLKNDRGNNECSI